MSDPAAFLSYAHRYRPWVKVLQQNLETCLKAAGRQPWKVFLDETDLGSGASWVGQLQVGLGRAEQLVLVVTPEALASAWVEKECFLAADGAEGRLHLAMLVETPLPPFLAPIQCVDFQPAGEPAYHRAVQRLAAGLLGKTGRLDSAALPSGLVPPPPLEPGLPSALRGRLLDWLEPRFAGKVAREAIASRLGFSPDVHGNVWEWTLSAWPDDYSGRERGVTLNPATVEVDHAAAEAGGGGTRVLRGGSCWFVPERARAAYRDDGSPGTGIEVLGFRVVIALR
ncbi:MAG TPA: TIR domain-containing protein [Thermoanaerobaculia bacterium]|nr:TIR domain-containing protein [Thermoanaerobaculia bacterium]